MQWKWMVTGPVIPPNVSFYVSPKKVSHADVEVWINYDSFFFFVNCPFNIQTLWLNMWHVSLWVEMQ